MVARDDAEFVFAEGVAPVRCIRCEGPLVECTCLLHGPHGRCDPGCSCHILPVVEHDLAEVVTLGGAHALVHAECLTDALTLA